MLQCSSRCHWGQQLVPASSFLPLQHCRRGIDSRRNGQWPSGMMHEDYSHLYRDLFQHRHSGVLRDRDKWMRKGHVAYGTRFLSWPQQLRGRKELGKEWAMAFNNYINQEFLCQLFRDETVSSYILRSASPTVCVMQPILLGGMTAFNEQWQKKHNKCSLYNLRALLV